MPRYFAPRKFEQWHGSSIYELLGVRFFKRYLLPTELLLSRLRGKKAIRGDHGALRAELKRLERETRRNEVIHLLALLLTACLLVFNFPHSNFRQLSAAQFLVIFALNLYLNVYPIFVQRYNRFRIMRLLRAYKL
jgi:glycosyl-4,4'-diaponeurosporenoate acyltransferase